RGGFAKGRSRPVCTTDVILIKPSPPFLRFCRIIGAAAGCRARAVFGGEESDAVFQGGGPIVAQRLPVSRRVEVDRIGNVLGAGDRILRCLGALLVPVPVAADDDAVGVDGPYRG